MIKQWAHDETADQADWLIGEDCLFPDVRGVALRSMKDPGSAYDDPAAVSLFSHRTTYLVCGIG
jgi:Zn-dependent metalloprotease